MTWIFFTIRVKYFGMERFALNVYFTDTGKNLFKLCDLRTKPYLVKSHFLEWMENTRGYSYIKSDFFCGIRRM